MPDDDMPDIGFIDPEPEPDNRHGRTPHGTRKVAAHLYPVDDGNLRALMLAIPEADRTQSEAIRRALAASAAAIQVVP